VKKQNRTAFFNC